MQAIAEPKNASTPDRLADLEKRLKAQPIAANENQLKNIKDKYLRDDPDLQTWLYRIAENVALAELLYDPQLRQRALSGVKHTLTSVDTGETKPTDLLLLHQGTESFDEMNSNHKRFIANLNSVAKSDADAQVLLEKRIEDFYQIMANWDFLPNSPTLMNAGRRLQQLSACYVLPVEDSVQGWAHAIADTMLIHKSGGGTGFSGCRVRPTGSEVQSTKGIASGSLSPMLMIDAVTSLIKQGGTRRGANMYELPAWHPDILSFITCKGELDDRNNEIYLKFKELTGWDEKFQADKVRLDQFRQKLLSKQIENFNISVATDEAFWQAVKTNGSYQLRDPRTHAVVKEVNALDIFNKIAEYAWRTGDPGMIIIDRINNSLSNTTPRFGQIEATNPCGEQPLLPNEPCNLGSINLGNFYDATKNAIDYDRLGKVTRTAIRFLEDVIDVNNYPTKDIENMAKLNRRIGLGVMGFGDLLVKLGVAYDSDQAVSIARDVMRFISENSVQESEALARERGVFPSYKDSTFDSDGKNFKPEHRARKPRHNAETTIAPTGTIGIASGCEASGIEPFFKIAYTRLNAKALDAKRQGIEPDEKDVFVYNNSLFDAIAKKHDYFGMSRLDLYQKISDNRGCVRGIKEIPQDIQRLFPSSDDVSAEYHVRIQAAFQEHTDNGVSKTINLPNSATVEDIKKIYLLAYDAGCKGITVYRDGSKSDQVLNAGSKDGTLDPVQQELDVLRKKLGYKPGERSKASPAISVKERLGEVNMYNAIAYKDGRPRELFTSVNTNDLGPQQAARVNGIHVSRRLASGDSVDKIVSDLQGIHTGDGGIDKGYTNNSIYDAIANSLNMRGYKMTKDEMMRLETLLKETELILLRGQSRYIDEKSKPRGANQTDIPSNRVTDIHKGNGALRMLPPCPNPSCRSTDYFMKMESGCEYYSCCNHSIRCI